MLRQVMANLTKNAVEAGAHRMDISLRQQDDHTEILVSNDGCPMKLEVAREVFVPFFTTKKNGSGIGLPLSRQMMMAQDATSRSPNAPCRHTAPHSYSHYKLIHDNIYICLPKQ